MVDWSRFEFLPERGRYWRSLVRDEKLRAGFRALSWAFLGIAIMLIIAIIAQEWPKGAVVDTLIREVVRRPFLLLLLGIAAAIIALFVVLWVVGVLWAWIMLPFTLQQGVAALNGLRLEVRRLRRRLPPSPAARGDDFDDSDG